MSRRAKQLSRIGAWERGRIKRAGSEEGDGADALIQIVDQVDLRPVCAGGVGIGERGGVGDGIDGDPLRSLGQTAKDQIRAAIKNLRCGACGRAGTEQGQSRCRWKLS